MMYHITHIRVTERRKEISIKPHLSTAHRALNIIFLSPVIYPVTHMDSPVSFLYVLKPRARKITKKMLSVLEKPVGNKFLRLFKL
jgi:hypothetical protein